MKAFPGIKARQRKFTFTSFHQILKKKKIAQAINIFFNIFLRLTMFLLYFAYR